MASADVFNTDGEIVSSIDLDDGIFNIDVNPPVLSEVVRMQLACKRGGNASVKRRSDVRGSTRKLFRQKGTGNARRGSKKSPLLKGGGVVFGPSPKSYAYSIPKKKKKLALKMALSTRFQKEKLFLIDDFVLDEIKTKKFVAVLQKLNIKNVLIVTAKRDEKLEMSARNVQGVKVLRTEGLNVYDILKYEDLLLCEPSIKSIEGRLA